MILIVPQYKMQLHNNIVQKSIEGLIQPIRYPTNIVIVASPNYPYIRNPELYWQVNFLPYSNGNIKKSPYVAEKVNPSIIEDKYDAAKYIPNASVSIKTQTDNRICPIIKNCSFLEGFSLTNAKANLNNVMNPQNKELNVVACWIVDTLFKTGYEEIQPPKATYSPM